MFENDFIKYADDIVVSVRAIRSVHVTDSNLFIMTDATEYCIDFDTNDCAQDAMNKTLEYLNIIEVF